MTNAAKLRLPLVGWDGKDMSVVRDLAEVLNADEVTLDALAALCVDDDAGVVTGSTWLVHHLLQGERGRHLSSTASATLLQALATLPWQGQLHVLQSFDRVVVDASLQDDVLQDVWTMCDADNKLVRAWALFALHQLATQFADLRDMATGRLQAAFATETGAVKVRARKALEAGFADGETQT